MFKCKKSHPKYHFNNMLVRVAKRVLGEMSDDERLQFIMANEFNGVQPAPSGDIFNLKVYYK